MVENKPYNESLPGLMFSPGVTLCLWHRAAAHFPGTRRQRIRRTWP
jgi:hypothetical protein